MKVQTLVSVAGEDQEGFFNKLTVKTKELGGKWLANKFAHLEGQMVAILKLEIDEQELPAFKQLIESFEGLQVSYREASAEQIPSGTMTTFTLEGEDRSGLTSDITRLLVKKDVKVEHYESRRYPITELGTDVFEARLDLRLPLEVSAEELKTELENLGGRIRVFLAEA